MDITEDMSRVRTIFTLSMDFPTPQLNYRYARIRARLEDVEVTRHIMLGCRCGVGYGIRYRIAMGGGAEFVQNRVFEIDNNLARNIKLKPN